MSELLKLKKEYSKLASKYNLPKFEILNQKFDIEKLAGRETDMLLREIRRAIMEKAVTYFKFVEIFLNPGTAPMFFLAMIKRLNGIAREPLEEIYVELGKLEIESIELENSYDEKKEAEFIKSVNQKWDNISKKFTELLEKINFSLKARDEKKDRSYFG